jgi:deoxyribonuclease I
VMAMAAEQKGNGYVITDVYCQKEYNVPGPGKMPNNSMLNVEHTWPQSQFGGSGKGLQKSDMHHLFASDSKLNSDRGSLPFGTVLQEKKALKCPVSRVGYDSSGRTVFEPPTDHKGNVARALFYFAARYSMKIDPVQEAALKEWNHEDPVDEAEILRNDEIENIQGNRNPFIDKPELADAIADF